MDKSKIYTNQVGSEDKKLKGLQSRGLITFECADCNKSLLCLQLTEIEGEPPSEILMRVGVKCGFCQGYSYIKQVTGQFSPGAPNDHMAFDVLNHDDSAPEADILFKAWKK